MLYRMIGTFDGLRLVQFLYGSDNYGYLIRDEASGACAAVDAGDGARYGDVLDALGWTLSDIFITHHHGDHTNGLAELVEGEPDIAVWGPDPATSHKPLAAVNQPVRDGSKFEFAGRSVEVIATPGHTLDMVNFYLADSGLLFSGDTLFHLGCGRVFEGDMAMMQASLAKLIALPDEVEVCCSHEYSAANARFALSVEPEHAGLKAQAAAIEALRANGEPTVPTRLGLEKQLNPFLRWDDADLRAALGLEQASQAEVFAEVRTRKDNF